MDADVIVAGAGPVGLLLAAELKLAGAEPLVLERLPTPSEETKARGLGVLATELLWRRGLGERLAEADAAGTRDLARDHGTTLGHFANIHKLVPDPDRPRATIWQPQLERLLTEHALALGVRIVRGHEVTEMESDDEVTVNGRWRARYLVGCDGGRSTVRKLAGFAFPGTPPLLRTTAGRVRFGGDVPPGGRYPAGAFLHGGSMAGVTEPAGDAEPAGPVTATELADGIRRVTGAAAVVEELTDGRRFGDQARQASTYRNGNVFLAGDAAHVHSPSGGQGLNLGLLDAANLGWKLAAAAGGRAPEGLLDSYTRERHPAGEAVLRNTRAQSALLAPGPHVDALREIVAELMDLPDANRYFADLLSGVHQRCELPYPATDPAGRYTPDLALAGDDGRVTRLHEHTRTGRGLLLLTPDTRHLADERVDVVPVTSAGPLLLRPDGVIAWAGEGSPKAALDAWF
ncbi:FAD-dependent monooxygenase [Amycolatopsis sp. cmx-8-4]|uniref:FAD-dependent monooxygenase n=1 Tax=Amycolatopsis sp. cmx-8-4 TaxID=2790947 RepID=UPI00397B994A